MEAALTSIANMGKTPAGQLVLHSTDNTPFPFQFITPTSLYVAPFKCFAGHSLSAALKIISTY